MNTNCLQNLFEIVNSSFFSKYQLNILIGNTRNKPSLVTLTIDTVFISLSHHW